VADSTTIASALAPGVALTSAVIYWANLQSRMDSLALRVRGLNRELREDVQGSPRALSIQRQVAMLTKRSRVLHVGVVLSVMALICFLGASAILFIALARSMSAGRWPRAVHAGPRLLRGLGGGHPVGDAVGLSLAGGGCSQ
jgi:hypothetical protein